MNTEREKRKITHSCGHVGVLTVRGVQESRDKWIAECASSVCKACWLKAQPVVFTISGTTITVTRGYPIRDDLRAMGYWFQRPVWRKRLPAPDVLHQEIAWMEANEHTVQYVCAEPRNPSAEEPIQQ